MGITNPAEVHFGKGLWGWLASTWVKLAALWGYSDRWNQNLSETCSAAGYVLKQTTAVPAGYVYVLEAVSMVLVNRATTWPSISLSDGATAVSLNASATLAANTLFFWVGRVTLKAGDYVELYLSGSQSGDTFTAGVWGYKMVIS